MIKCETHGLQDCAFNSPYVTKLINLDIAPSQKIFRVKLYLHILSNYASFFAEEAFLQRHGLDLDAGATSITIKPENEQKSFDIYADLAPACVKCYQEYVSKFPLGSPQAGSSTAS